VGFLEAASFSAFQWHAGDFGSANFHGHIFSKAQVMHRHKSLLIPAMAATASFLLLAAPPAQAAPILIDDFQTAQTAAAFTNNTTFVPSVTSGTLTGSFGGLTDRAFSVLAVQFASPQTSKTFSAGVSGGLGNLLVSNSGTGGNITPLFSLIQWSGSTAQDWTLGGNTLRIVTGSTSTTLSPATLLPASVRVGTGTSGGTITNFEPDQNFFWPNNGVVEIPFSAFPGADFTQVRTLGISIGRNQSPSTTVAGTTFSASASFSSISVVPEPHSLAVLGVAGAAVGGGLILRRQKKVLGTFFATRERLTPGCS
jgi:hypothetical protein